MELVPKVIERVVALVDVNVPVLKLKVFRFSVPLLKRMLAFAETVKALPRVNVRPTPLNVTLLPLPIVTPLVVMVAVLRKNSVPEFDHVVVADRVKLPVIDKLPVPVRTHVEPVVVKEAHARAPVMVMVGVPELASTMTASFCEGTTTPPAPPDVLDQLVVVDVSQVPVPPTQ